MGGATSRHDVQAGVGTPPCAQEGHPQILQRYHTRHGALCPARKRGVMEQNAQIVNCEKKKERGSTIEHPPLLACERICACVHAHVRAGSHLQDDDIAAKQHEQVKQSLGARATQRTPMWL